MLYYYELNKKPSMVFYSSAHLNQDWSSGDCTVMKNLIQHSKSFRWHFILPEAASSIYLDAHTDFLLVK